MPRERTVPVPLVAVVPPHGPQFAAQAVDHAVGVEGRAGGVVVDGGGHGDINLTMGVYTHSYREDEAAAVNKLPDLSHDPTRQRATGTADPHADDRDDARLALCLAQTGGLHETAIDSKRRSTCDHAAKAHAGVAELADAADSKSAGS